jgi:hypothetical protein
MLLELYGVTGPELYGLIQLTREARQPRLSRAEERKSSYSGQSGNWVEVARNLPGLWRYATRRNRTGCGWWFPVRPGRSSS